MTPRQRDCLEFVRDYWLEHDCSPSYQEICDGLGLKSKSGVWHLLNGLQDQGYVTKTFNEVRSVTPIEIAPSKPEKAETPWG